MLKTISIIAFLVLINSGTSFALDSLTHKIPNAKPVGEGRLTYMFWDVYDAKLFAPNGQFNKEKPFAISLTYLRNIEGRKIADRSIVEMRNLGFTDEIRLATWHSQMNNIFPNVEEGMTLTGVYNDKKESIFYKGNIEVGRITDPDFGRYFFDIWLNQKTSAPDLRASLLGLK